jgi:DNA-binding MarR family transcriptional regulator
MSKRQPQSTSISKLRLTCPEHRLSSSTATSHGRTVINIETYIPYFLAAVNNALSRGAAQIYSTRFGIGIAEWRVVSMLAIEPGIAAARMCAVIAQDKAATSRALNQLQREAYVAFDATSNDPRRKIWRLTDAGYALHDQIMALALDRECRLITNVDPDDLEAFLRVMRTMRRNVVDLGSI